MSQNQTVLAEYLPKDTLVLSTYAEVYEVIRSPKMRPEPLHWTQEPLVGDSVMTLTGAEHIRRRRALNALVRPSALERYRKEITIPTLKSRLKSLQPDSDGRYRTDLVPFLKRCFVEFATALLGVTTEADPDERREYLADISDELHLGFHAKWMREDHGSYIAAGEKGKAAYAESFFAPALQRLREDARPQETLAWLLATHADPSWADADLAMRESILLLIGTVETSATIITHAIDELDRWFEDHPDDRERAEDDVEFLGNVIQETLRLNPVQPHMVRVALEDCELANGTLIQQGQWVASLTGSANRDSGIFGPNADSFDPYRQVPAGIPRYGVGFGAGPHQCLGLRIVLGNTGAGSHAHALRELYRAGVRPERDREMRRENSARAHFEEFLVVFDELTSYR